MTNRMNRLSLSRARILVVSAVLAGSAIGAVGAQAQATRGTYGPIPTGAMVPGAAVDIAKVPDYVGVVGPDGDVAGYVSKLDLFDVGPMPASPEEAASLGEVVGSMPVYDQGGNIIGDWTDDNGFVAGTTSEVNSP